MTLAWPSRWSPQGLSGASQVSIQQRLTTAGTIVGTLQYMAPEQLEGKTIDARTDIFAFGAVLYEMLTGHTAFTASNQAALITAILASDPPSLQSFNVTTAPGVEWLLWKCLAKDPDKRWQSARRPGRRARVGGGVRRADTRASSFLMAPSRAAHRDTGRIRSDCAGDHSAAPCCPTVRSWSVRDRIARWCAAQPLVSAATGFARRGADRLCWMESAGQRVWVRDVSAGTTAPVAGTDKRAACFGRRMGSIWPFSQTER